MPAPRHPFRRIPVAYENPRANNKELDAYREAVEKNVRRMGASSSAAQDVVHKDEAYVAASFRAAFDPKMAAAVIYHKHAGDMVVAAEGAALGASCPPGAVRPTNDFKPPNGGPCSICGSPLPHDHVITGMGGGGSGPSSAAPPGGPVRVPGIEKTLTVVVGASCPPQLVGPAGSLEGPAPPAGANGPPPPADGGGPFTKIVRDEKRFAPFRQRALDIGSISTPKQAYALLAPDLGHELQECFVVVGFDVNMVVLCYEEIARGQVDHVAVAPGDVLAPILIAKCKKFLVAHNHPSGDARPSDDDKKLTDAIKAAAWPFKGLVFLDHLVIGRGEVWSFTENKLTQI